MRAISVQVILGVVWGVGVVVGQQGGRLPPGVNPQHYQHGGPPPPGGVPQHHIPQQQMHMPQQHHVPGVPPQQFQQQQMGHQHVPQHPQQHQVPQQFQPPPPQHVQQQHHQPPPQHQQQHVQQQQQLGGHAHGHEHEQGRLLDASNVLKERSHIQEHMDVPIDTSQMTEQELQFHYFKMHDADNNNKLDGCELVKSLIHWHDSANHNPASGHPVPEPKIFADEELVQMIDPILQNDDLNRDGMIDYAEFSRAQANAAARAGQQGGQQH